MQTISIKDRKNPTILTNNYTFKLDKALSRVWLYWLGLLCISIERPVIF